MCLTAPDVDAIVELIGGLDPIEDWLRTALSAGKHVITANKQLMAFRGTELLDLAAKNNVQLLFGASVAGGVPVIPGMVQGLSGDRIRRISGIVNGTCNFILSSMETGANYGEVLANAQRAGYAEADPSADVDGLDARAKLCILARLALKAEIHPENVPAQTIKHVGAVDFPYAKELGCTIRQVSRAQLDGDVVRARVGPMLVPKTSPIAWSHGTQNMIVTSGEFGGDVVFSGHGAGGHPTAVAVMSDVLAVAQGSSAVRLPVAEAGCDGRCQGAALSAARRLRQTGNRCSHCGRAGEGADQHRLHPAAPRPRERSSAVCRDDRAMPPLDARSRCCSDGIRWTSCWRLRWCWRFWSKKIARPISRQMTRRRSKSSVAM